MAHDESGSGGDEAETTPAQQQTMQSQSFSGQDLTEFEKLAIADRTEAERLQIPRFDFSALFSQSLT